MSIFASYVTTTGAIPWDPGQTVTIQRLSGNHLAAARQASITASMAFVKQMGGPAMQRELADVTADAVKAELATRAADPLRQYDRATVLAHGVKAWTYPDPVTPDRLDDLTDDAADFLAREILALTLPNGAGEKKTAT